MSVVPAQWPGDTIGDLRRVARQAAAVGIGRIWMSEVNGYDAMGVAAALAAEHDDLGFSVGPLAVGVRSPALIASGMATLAGLTRGPIDVVLGASTRRIVEEWHGRRMGNPVDEMEGFIAAVRAASAGARTAHDGNGWSSHGFRLSVPPIPGLPVRVAAHGPRMIAMAARRADGLVFNLVTPPQAARLVQAAKEAVSRAGTKPPSTAVWMSAGSADHAAGRIGSFLRPYVAARGYREHLAEAGVTALLARDPAAAASIVAAFGPEEARRRIAAYAEAGVDEVAVVVSGADPVMAEVLEAIAS